MRRREFITVLGGRGGMAARGARAADGQAADHRVPGREHAFVPEPMDRRFCAAAARTRLDRGPHRRDRVSLGGGTRANAAPRSRPSSSGSRSMSLSRREPRCHRGKAGDIGHPDRVRGGGRPGWHRPGRQSRATGRQRHRPVDPADRSCRQAARTVARGCPRSPPAGDHGQCRQSRRRAGDGRGSGSGPHARPRSRHARNPASRGYRARLRGAQGPRGRTLCCHRSARNHQPDSHQHLGAGRATADDARISGATSKREV